MNIRLAAAESPGSEARIAFMKKHSETSVLDFWEKMSERVKIKAKQADYDDRERTIIGVLWIISRGVSSSATIKTEKGVVGAWVPVGDEDVWFTDPIRAANAMNVWNDALIEEDARRQSIKEDAAQRQRR